jgi:serine/threonine protein kinase
LVAAERRYWILELLGSGGFGAVYRAELQGRGGFRKNVALKMLHPDRTSSPEMVRRLRDEARLLAHVSHPGIVQVDGLIQLRGQWTVVMEYVQGVTLRELVALGPIPILCAVQLVERVAEALDAAHFAKDGDRPLELVHRDIKPSNILLTPDGSVKLLDFGVVLANPEVREARTDDLFFGAPEYMAPERWDFVDTTAADVYSLGALFWELLTGEILGRTSAKLSKHSELVEDAADQIGHIGNARLTELILAMLAYNPKERPTAREVARTCQELEPHVPGPWLRDWAEREVPRARSRRQQNDDDPLLDMLLTESEHDEVTSILPSTASERSSRGTRIIALLAVAALAGLTLWAVRATNALREADDRSGGKAVSSMRTVAPPMDVQIHAAPEPAEAADAPPQGASSPQPSTGDPERSPASSTVAASPTRRSTPAPAPVAPPATATVTVQGDADGVFLVAAGRKHSPGTIPAGSYVIEARFDGRGLVEAGQIELAPDSQVTLICDSGFALCKAQ